MSVQRAKERFLTIIQTGQKVSLREYETEVGPGREHTYWDSENVALFDANGEVDGILLFSREVTDQVLSRKKIEELAATDEAILNNMTEDVAVANANGTVLLLNPSLLCIHQLSRLYDRDKKIDDYRSHVYMSDLDGTPLQVQDWPLSRALRGEVFQNVEVLLITKPAKRPEKSGQLCRQPGL